MGVDPKVAGWNVLIVDDEIDNRTIAAHTLTYQGASVILASNGEQGLECLTTMMQTTPPTFVLLDISMPVMDGWEMLAAIRANPALAGVPVIALTAHAMQGDDEKVRSAGFNGYITKPFRLKNFINDIKACLEGSHPFKVTLE